MTGAPGVALVVGASRGLGLAIAADLAARGHRIVIAARDEAEVDQAHSCSDPRVRSTSPRA